MSPVRLSLAGLSGGLERGGVRPEQGTAGAVAAIVMQGARATGGPAKRLRDARHRQVSHEASGRLQSSSTRILHSTEADARIGTLPGPPAPASTAPEHASSAWPSLLQHLNSAPFAPKSRSPQPEANFPGARPAGSLNGGSLIKKNWRGRVSGGAETCERAPFCESPSLARSDGPSPAER